MSEIGFYRDPHRGRHLVFSFVAAAATVGLLVLQPQLAAYLKGDTRPLRGLVLAVAGALGVFAVRMGMEAAFAGLEKRQTVVSWRNLLSWSLYVLLLLMIGTSAGINLSALLFAGGVLSVVLAIAAQSTLNNFFAGLVLLVVRPYRIGDSVYLRSGNFGGAQYEGLIVDIGSLYTTLSSNGELFRIPNSVVIGSVLVPDYRPVRADVLLDLSPSVGLRELEERVGQRLGLQTGARIQVIPTQYAMQEGGPRAGARLLIRSLEWVPAEAVLNAIDAAVHELSTGEPKPRLVDASDAGPARP